MESKMKAVFKSAIFTAMLAAGIGQASAGCNTSVTGTGSAKNNEPLAKSRAKDDWRDKAAASCSSASWVKSDGKQLVCGRSGKLGNRTWTCAATSTPAK